MARLSIASHAVSRGMRRRLIRSVAHDEQLILCNATLVTVSSDCHKEKFPFAKQRWTFHQFTVERVTGGPKLPTLPEPVTVADTLPP